MWPWIGRRRHRAAIQTVRLLMDQPRTRRSGDEIAADLDLPAACVRRVLAELEAAGVVVSTVAGDHVDPLRLQRRRRFYRLAVL